MKLHQRQFLIGPEPLEVDEGWSARELTGGRWLSHSTALRVHETAHGIVLGLAICEGHPDGWSGRWVLLAGAKLELDPGGLLGVFVRDEWLSSSPELLRALPPELPLPERRLVHERPIDWFPPPRSGIPGIRRLLPSQTIDIATGEVAPRALFADDAPTSVAELAQLLVESLRRLEHVDIALTSGRDSRLILAAALAAGTDVLTHTTVRDTTPYGDVSFPPRLARIAGVPHYTIRAGRINEELVALADRHCAFHSAVPARYGLASGELPDLGRPVATGLILELGRRFYGDQPSDMEGRLAEMVREWVDWVRVHPEEIDWRDRLYWEQRLGGWVSSTAQLLDLAPFERFIPANNRRFITGLLGFPEPERRRAAPQQAMLEHLSPELAAVPVNPERVARRARRQIGLLTRGGLRYLRRPAKVFHSRR